MNGPEALAHGDGASESPLLGAVVERFINWRTMPRRLRLVTGLALAQVIVAGVLILISANGAVRDHLPQVPLYVLDGQLVQTTAPILVATIIFITLAWSYILSGIIHSHWVVRVAGLALFTLAVFFFQAVNLIATGGPLWIQALLVAALWGVASWLSWQDVRAGRGQGDPERTHRLNVIGFAVITVIVGSFYVLGYLAARADNASLLFTSQLSTQLTALSVLLIPILFIAGVDFAELAQLVGGRAAAFAGRWTNSTAVAALVVCVAGAVLGWWLHVFWPRLPSLGVDLTLGIGACLIIALLLRGGGAFRLRAEHVHVPYWAIALAVVISFGVTYAILVIPLAQQAQARAPGATFTYAPFTSEAPPLFSAEKPTTWVTSDQVATGLKTTVVDGHEIGDPAFVIIYAFGPASGVTDSRAAVGDTLLTLTGPNAPWHQQTAYLAHSSHESGWQVYDVGIVAQTPGLIDYRARIWVRSEGSSVWEQVAFCPAQLWNFNQPAFEHIATTWAPRAVPEAGAASAAPAPAVSDTERAETITFGVLMVAGLVLLVLTRMRGRGHHGRTLTIAATFVVITTVLGIVALPGYILDTLTNTPGHDLTSFHIEGIQTLIALASMAFVAWAAITRRLRASLHALVMLLGLNVALQIVSWIYDVYSAAQSVGNFSVAQAVIVLLAFLVDILLSGEAITNRDSKWFPRHARVQLYFGYILAAVAVILYFSTLRFQATGAAAPSQFESEFWPQAGLIQFGIPVILTVALVGLLHARGGTTEARA